MSDDTPPELKQLVRCVMRTFYGLLPRLIMDALMKHGLMQRDQIATLLKLDKNKIQAQLAMLSGEKLVKTRIKMETTAADDVANGVNKRPLSAREQAQRTSRHTFYYVNYRGFLNSVKYKLDHVRRRLESQEKEAMYNRSLFRCTQCKAKYSEMDVIRLFSRERNAYFCFYCQAELAEEGDSGEADTPANTETVTPANNSSNGTPRSNGSAPSKPNAEPSKSWAGSDVQSASKVPSKPADSNTSNDKAATNGAETASKSTEAAAKNGDAAGAFQKKSRVALFHEQTRPIVDRIRICERLDLTRVFAAAENAAIFDLASTAAGADAPNAARNGRFFAAPGGVKREPGGGKLRPNLNLVIEMDGMTSANAVTPKVKETPTWLKNDTSAQFKAEPPTPLSPASGVRNFPFPGGSSPMATSAADEERIRRLVFQREVMRPKRPEGLPNSVVKKERGEELDCSALRFDWLMRPVLVAGEQRPFCSLTQTDVARMSKAEQAEYVRVGRQLYELCE